MEKILEKIENLKMFVETLIDVIKTPMTISILESLKELRGIKKNRTEILKNTISTSTSTKTHCFTCSYDEIGEDMICAECHKGSKYKAK